MTAQDPLPALSRILDAIVGFAEALVAAPAAIAAHLADYVHDRLDRAALRLGNRILRLLRGKPAPRPAAPRASPAKRAPAIRPPAFRHPRRRGWLLDAMPDTAPAIAGEIRAALQDPALAAFFAHDPAAARILQPLCRMLGLDLAEFLPAAPPVPEPAVPSPARPSAEPNASPAPVTPLPAPPSPPRPNSISKAA